jgi:hypothetical protein
MPVKNVADDEEDSNKDSYLFGSIKRISLSRPRKQTKDEHE